MKYLLDTLVWLWSVGPSKTIGTTGLEILASAEEEIYLSAASSWEIAMKTRLGKFQLPEPPGRYVPKRLRVYDLPSHHADPFDRMIIAQAMVEQMTVLTSDREFEKYPIDVIWCGK